MRTGSSRSLITEFRIFIRIIIETIKGLKQTGWMNLVIITTMAAILTIFGSLFRTSLALSNFIDEMGNILEISVYVKQSANTQSVIRSVKSIDSVEKVQLITKETSWDNLQKQMNVPKIKNPLPDTLHVKLKDQDSRDSAINKLEKISGVEDIRYAKELAEDFKLFSNIGKIATIVVLIILGSLTMFIISNTIQLAIHSKRNEIEIMRLMGVNNWYIKAPFILQGGVYGMVGAIISVLPLNILQTYLAKANAYFGMASSDIMINLVLFSLFIMGVFFGAGGSIMSIKKYLKV